MYIVWMDEICGKGTDREVAHIWNDVRWYYSYWAKYQIWQCLRSGTFHQQSHSRCCCCCRYCCCCCCCGVGGWWWEAQYVLREIDRRVWLLLLYIKRSSGTWYFRPVTILSTFQNEQPKEMRSPPFTLSHDRVPKMKSGGMATTAHHFFSLPFSFSPFHLSASEEYDALLCISA